MSRTVRTGPVEGFWATLDAWAEQVVEPSRVRAWWQTRAQLDAECGPYLDVTGPLDGFGRRLRRWRPAVASRGLAVADDVDVQAALVDRGVEHRRVDAARRYRWTGPAMTPVALEVHTAGDEAVVEAWWEDVWMAWPRIRLGKETEASRPPRRATATAQIARLLDALGHEPIGNRDAQDPG